MHLDLLPVHLAFFGLQPWAIAIVIPVFGMILGGAIAISSMYFQHQRRQLWHETARLALEKGQPISAITAELESRPKKDTPLSDVRAGVICIAVAAGIYLSMRGMLPPHGAKSFMGAYIPGFIGIAFLINAGITAFVSRKSNRSDTETPPAQS